jgi:hypothetical protein
VDGGVGARRGWRFVLGFLLLGFALGALFTPVAPAVVEALAVDPAVLNAFRKTEKLTAEAK